jgi:hypothetical protein
VQDYKESAESSKQALAAEQQANTIAANASAAVESLRALHDAAQHAALSSDPTTATDVKGAETHQKRLQIYVKLAAAEVVKLQQAFAKALEAPQPTPKKSTGDLTARQKTMRENLEASKAYDKTVQVAIAGAVGSIADYAAKAADESKAVEDLRRAWEARVAKYEREAAAERKQAEALKQSRDAVQRGEAAYAEADQKKKLDTAKDLGIKLPDLAGLNATMTAAALKPDWPAAGSAAEALIRTIAQLDKTIVVIRDLKENFEAAKKRTSSRLNKLVERFDAAKVSDVAILTTLQDLLTKANEHARKMEWEQAGVAITDFEQKYQDAEDLAKEFEYYSGGTTPRLLTGTIIAVCRALPKGSTNKVTLDRLAEVFEQQCEVPRGEWLTLLGIAGANVKIGSASDHYTTFNNSVPVGTDVSVFNSTANNAGAVAVCGELFEVVAPVLRIHATFVVGVDRYHRYWSRGAPIYSPNVVVPNPYPALDARYQTMVNEMTSKVLEVIKVYGRVGTKKQGPII